MKSIVNTTITFGQVTAPVKVYSAASSITDISPKLCGPDGEAVQQVYRLKDEPDTIIGTKNDCSRIYDGRLVDEAELKAAEAASLIEEIDGEEINLKETIKIQKFVPLAKVPFERATASYYLGADAKRGGVESLALIHKALAKKKVAGVAKFVLRGRQKEFVIYAEGDALYAVALSFASDRNAPTDDVTLHAKVTVDKNLVELATKLIDADLDKDGTIVDELSDTLVDRKIELLNAGEPIRVKETEAPTVGESLADALEASLKGKVSA